MFLKTFLKVSFVVKFQLKMIITNTINLIFLLELWKLLYAKGKCFTYTGKECNNGGTNGNDDDTSVTSCKFIFWKQKEKETIIMI